MLGLGRKTGEELKKEAYEAAKPGQKAAFMTKGEILKMVIVAGLLIAVLQSFRGLASRLTRTETAPVLTDRPVEGGESAPEVAAAGEAPKADPGDVVPGGNALGGEGEAAATEGELSDDEKQVIRERQAAWDELAKEHGLPADGATEAPGPDAGLLMWVDDGTDERERAPYFHLLKYVLARSHEQIDAEVDQSVAFDWLALPQDRVEEKLQHAADIRGKIVTVKGMLLDIYQREIADERSPRPFVWEAIIADKDRNVFMVVCADKEIELRKEKDLVQVTGPFFKILKVETQDTDPDRRYKGFPLIVTRALRKIEIETPRPGLFANPLIIVGAGVFGLLALFAAVSFVRKKREVPGPPRRRSMLNNGKLRELDLTKRDPAAAGDHAQEA